MKIKITESNQCPFRTEDRCKALELETKQLQGCPYEGFPPDCPLLDGSVYVERIPYKNPELQDS